MNPPENGSAKANLKYISFPSARLELLLGGNHKAEHKPRNSSPGLFQERLMQSLVWADTFPNRVLCKCRSLKQVYKGNICRGDAGGHRACFLVAANPLD